MKGKKILIAVLCLIVIAAVAVGACWYLGVFEKPVEPDNRWTIRNLNLDIGEEEIAFSPEIRVSVDDETGKEGEAIRNALHFELGMGEKALMPVTAELKEGSLDFTIGNSGRVYSVTEDMLKEAIAEATDGVAASGMDPAIMDSLKAMFESLAAMAELQQDKDFAGRQQAMTEGMFEAMLGAPGEEAQIEIDGKSYKGRRYAGEYTVESSYAMLDYLRAYDEPAIAGYAQAMLDLMNAASGTEYASFADLYADMMGETTDVAGEMEMLIYIDKKLSYEKVTMTMDDGMGGQVNMVAEETMRGGAAAMTMEMTMDGTTMTLTMDYDDEAFNLDMDFDASTSSDMASMGITIDTKESLQLTAAGAKTEGLWNADADMNISTETTYDFGDGPETDSMAVALNGSYAETLEEDQSITGAVGFTLDVGGVDYGLGFEVNRGKDAVIPALVGEGTEVHPLAMEADAEVYTLLQADAMEFVADASELMTDAGITRVVELAGGMFGLGSTDETDTTDEGSFDDDYVTVMSYEEAAEVYQGRMPAFTAPAGFELLGINVCPDDMIIGYSDGSRIFQISIIWMGDPGAEAAVLTPADYEYYEMDGMVYDAYAMTADTIIDFAFEGMDRAEAEAIIAGLIL